MPKITISDSERVWISDLTPHPRNYRTHPEDQIEHLKQSIKDHGLYRNVLIANDGTILAGHGVVQAAKELGMRKVSAVRLTVGPDHPMALKVMAADNSISNLSADDDRLLTDLLKQINEDDQLLGTGFDDKSLATYLMVTRNTDEIESMDVAAEWVGMPDFEGHHNPPALRIEFTDEAGRETFINEHGGDLMFVYRKQSTWSARWPASEHSRDDLVSVTFEG